ncbi:MAG: phospholipid/cholesterol/gamma-HCH transport system permease protein [Pseudonocardiales bacterium]|jgi:phospholipid/cholesterol/gamma-HCH transport system permease protein|nr:phospholipid/cholesterol/gamma-HCH transport system permease protein [Pseudonocardiales bacterium]
MAALADILPSGTRDLLANVGKRVGAVERQLRFLGDMVLFTFHAVRAIPLVMRRYREEVKRQIGQITLGTGLFITFTGTLGVIVAESLFIGIEVGVEGFQSLNIIGIAPLTGFISAYGNTREIAPIIAAIAVASQIGCKFTSQLGAQRISEEIDALEVMAIPSIPYLVTTRIVGAFTVIVPLYLVGLFGSYIATKYTVTIFFGQSAGTYEHYFNQFLRNIDVFYSVVKVMVFTVFITIIHTYYGYNATGGPAGVGRATARAIRATTVIIASTDVLMTMLFWGLHGVRLGGG